MNLFKQNIGESARDYVYRLIRENIISWGLMPGESVTVQRLSDLTNVSRTPVREALLQLQFEKVIDVFPRKGCFISYLNFELANNYILVRRVLELTMLEILCNNIDETGIALLENNIKLQKLYAEQKRYHELFSLDNDFHRLFFQLAGHLDVVSIYQSFSIHADRIRSLGVHENHQTVVDLLADHQALIDAIKQKDMAQIRTIITRHICGFSDDLQNKLHSRHPEYFE